MEAKRINQKKLKEASDAIKARNPEISKILANCNSTQSKMSRVDFLSHCAAQGGDWTSMLMTGIEDLSKTDCRFKKLWDSMEDGKSYEFVDVWKSLLPIVDLNTKAKKNG